MNTNQLLFLQIEDFFQKLQDGEYDHPLDLANILEELSTAAWDEAYKLIQPSIRIDP